MTSSTEDWFKVTIPHGSNLNRDELVSLMKPHFLKSFDQIHYFTDESAAYFFVKGSSSADNIKQVSRRCLKADGRLLVFHVTPSKPPAIRTAESELMGKEKDEKDQPVCFDVEPTVTLPATMASYFVNERIQNLIVSFINEYFTIFDSNKRSALKRAYDQNVSALFLMYGKKLLLDRQPGSKNKSGNLKNTAYIDSGRINSVNKTGVDSVLYCLETLPMTTHDGSSFVVHVSLATPTLLTFSVQGLFTENESATKCAFSRTFTAVPSSGPGMLIVNDLWTISNTSNELVMGVDTCQLLRKFEKELLKGTAANN